MAAVAGLLLALVAVSGCRAGDHRPADPPGTASADGTRKAEEPTARQVSAPRIVALGDSLTAGYGLEADEAYPARLQQRIDAAGLNYQVVNMGVSGDTSAGGLRRLDWALEGDVRVLIVALGGNDALRGLSPDDLASNLGAIVDRAKGRGIDVLLAGMEAPPNFGAEYTRAFRDVYPRVARERGVVLVPFLLEGVAGVPRLNQPDGIHPTAEGTRLVADSIWARLEPMLQERASR